jgi:hypothetical protein
MKSARLVGGGYGLDSFQVHCLTYSLLPQVMIIGGSLRWWATI